MTFSILSIVLFSNRLRTCSHAWLERPLLYSTIIGFDKRPLMRLCGPCRHAHGKLYRWQTQVSAELFKKIPYCFYSFWLCFGIFGLVNVLSLNTFHQTNHLFIAWLGHAPKLIGRQHHSSEVYCNYPSRTNISGPATGIFSLQICFLW